MTPLAMLFMALSVSGVTALAAWCYYRVLSAPPEESKEPDRRIQED